MVVGYLQVSFGSEGFLANGASEGFVARVRSHMNLKSGTRREVLIAHVT